MPEDSLNNTLLSGSYYVYVSLVHLLLLGSAYSSNPFLDVFKITKIANREEVEIGEKTEKFFYKLLNWVGGIDRDWNNPRVKGMLEAYNAPYMIIK